MPDSERELKLRHTSEGAEKVRADVESVAQAEGKLGDAVDDAGKSTDDLRIKKENLINVLSRIHPALGAFVNSLANAAELAGDLSKKNIDLNGVLELGRGLIGKYKDALLLMGAGGAAAGAVLLLIHTWKNLNQEMEKALELVAAAELQRNVADRAAMRLSSNGMTPRMIAAIGREG